MKDPKLNGGAGRSGSRHIDTLPAPPRPVIGLEAEFTLFVDDVKRRPEDVFGTPAKAHRPANDSADRQVVSAAERRRDLLRYRRDRSRDADHRARAGLLLSRDASALGTNPLRAPGARRMERAQQLPHAGCRASARITISPSRPRVPHARGPRASSPFSSRTSCRSRRCCSRRIARAPPSACGRAGSRLEVTADFTPDAALMLATCAFIAGVVEGVLHWDNYAHGSDREAQAFRA